MKKFVPISLFLFTNAFAQVVNVADFGAFPDDDKCDIASVKSAIEQAKKIGAKEIKFSKGVYDFKVGDAEKNRGIDIKNLDDVTFSGETNKNGEPATTFLRSYDFKNAMNAAEILLVSNSKNFTLKNVIFDNNPRYMTAGEIVENDGKSVTVKVLENNPCIDGTIVYCGNVWDKKNRNLLKRESVTYGGFMSSDVDERKDEYTMRSVGDVSERLLKVSSKEIAGKVNKGEIFSWHFGWLGYQVNFARCENLKVENVHTYSAIGVAINSILCKNTTAKNVKFLRQDNQMQVGCRDAWIVQLEGGNFSIDNMYCEGVRWDGQNICGRFGFVYGVEGDNSVIISNRNFGIKSFVFIKGTPVGFCNGRSEEVLLTIESVSDIGVSELSGKAAVKVTFKEPLPSFVKTHTLCNIYGTTMDSYEIKNSTFKNIAGSASVIRNDNVKISNCTFEYVMYPAVCIGGDVSCSEGPISKNVVVENSTFIDCAWAKRHDGLGAITVSLARSSLLAKDAHPYIKNVKLINNKFKNCDVAIEARGAEKLYISGSKFENVGEKIVEDDCLDIVMKK